MKRYLLALGGTGNKILESVVWAACADVMWEDGPEDTRRPIDELRLLSVDVDEACGNTTRAMQACASYMQARDMFEGFPGAHRGFNTALRLAQWDMDLTRRSTSVKTATENHRRDRLLSSALLTGTEADLQYSEGFRGHPDLGVLFFSDILRHLDEEEKKGRKDRLLEMLRDIEGELRRGEKVKVLLCGSIFGGTGASAMPVLSRFLRERFSAWRDRMEMGAVLMLPYFRVPAAARDESLEIVVSSDQFMDKARTALEYYGMEGMLRKSLADDKGLYDAAFLLGLPESCFVTAPMYSTGSQSQLNDAHLMEWLATRCAARFFRTDYRVDNGRNINCYYYQIASRRFGWEGFDEESALYRRSYGGLMKAACFFAAEAGPVLHDRLTVPRLSRDRGVNYYAAYFRYLRRMKAENRDAMGRQLKALDECLAGFARWMTQVIVNLPPILRNVAAREETEKQAAEGYRHVVELTAQLAILTRQAAESGMAEEKVVHRAGLEDTAAEEMMRSITARREALKQLTEAQEALTRKIGGQAQMEIIAAEKLRLTGLCEEQQAKIEARHAAMTTGAAQDAPKAQKDQGALRRMEKQLAYLTSQMEKVRADEEAAVLARLRQMPPEGGDEGDAVPGNDLFDREALSLLKKLENLAPEDKRERRRLSEEMGRLWHRLVLSPTSDPVDASRFLDLLGDGAGSFRGVSPLACLTAQMLENVMEEVR